MTWKPIQTVPQGMPVLVTDGGYNVACAVDNGHGWEIMGMELFTSMKCKAKGGKNYTYKGRPLICFVPRYWTEVPFYSC